jgi:hypothetical protein
MMKKCHEATSGDTATDRNPLSEIAHLVCGTLGGRCLSRGGGSAKLGTMQALPIASLALTLSSYSNVKRIVMFRGTVLHPTWRLSFG